LSSENDVLTPISNRVLNIDEKKIKQSLLELVNSDDNIKEQFMNDYKKNNINYRRISGFYKS
jgi:hypothetical protein